MRARDFLLFALFAALVLALLSPAVFLPGSALDNFGDLYAYHYPLRHLAQSSLQAGRLPFWNPYVFCGSPLAANPQAVLFYPAGLLCALLPLTLAFSWDYAFHLLWGGLGMLLLARREGLQTWAAAFLACIYGFSPFLLYRITEGIPTLLASLAWAPWCWLAFLSPWRGLLAAAWALQFLSGHPQFLVVNAVGMAVWALCRGGRRRLLGRFVLEGAAAAALAAVQWPATWQFLSRSVRRDWPQAFAAAYSVEPAALLTWLWPNAWGNPLAGTFREVPSVFFESSGVYIGWAGILAAAAGFWSARSWRPLILVGLGVFLSLGEHNPLCRSLGFGPIGFLRTPARYLFLSLWGLVLAAGAGAHRLAGSLKPAVKAFLLTAAAVELLAWGHRFVATRGGDPYLAANPALARAVAGRPFRILTDPELANPNKAMLYRALNVNGYDAFYLAGYPAFAAASEGRPAADSSRTYLSRADTPQMSRAAVAYRLTAGGGLEVNPTALPLAYFAAGPGVALAARPAITLERPERWRVEGTVPLGADRIVVTVPSYPGWRAWLNGSSAALEPWDYFQAVRLPASVRQVDLRLDFRPTLWPVWVLTALAAWLAWLASWRGAAVSGRGEQPPCDDGASRRAVLRSVA